MWDALDSEHKNVYKKKTEAAKKEYLKALAAYRASLVSKGASEGEPMYGPSYGGYQQPPYGGYSPQNALASPTQKKIMPPMNGTMGNQPQHTQSMLGHQQQSPMGQAMQPNMHHMNMNQGGTNNYVQQVRSLFIFIFHRRNQRRSQEAIDLAPSIVHTRPRINDIC